MRIACIRIAALSLALALLSGPGLVAADELDPETAEMLEWKAEMNRWLELANKGEKYKAKTGRSTLGPVNKVGIELAIEWPGFEKAYYDGERMNLATFCGYIWNAIGRYESYAADLAKIKKSVKHTTCVYDDKKSAKIRPFLLKKGELTFYVHDDLANLQDLLAANLKKLLKLKH